MEVYFGGAYQGKLDYVLDRKGKQQVADGAVCNMEDIKSADVLNHLHLYIQRIIRCDKSAYYNSEYDNKSYDTSVCGKNDYNQGAYDKNIHYKNDYNQNVYDMDSLIDEIYAANPDIILICDEVGSGIVPIEKKDRIYREAVGRALCRAVKISDRVERIMCGIGQCLKDITM